MLTRFFNLFRSQALEQELDDELRFHLEERAAANLRLGMDREDAEAAAREQFGSLTRAKDGMREARMISRHVVAAFVAGVLLGAAASSGFWVRHRPSPEIAASHLAEPRRVTSPVLLHEGKVRLFRDGPGAKDSDMNVRVWLMP